MNLVKLIHYVIYTTFKAKLEVIIHLQMISKYGLGDSLKKTKNKRIKSLLHTQCPLFPPNQFPLKYKGHLEATPLILYSFLFHSAATLRFVLKGFHLYRK